ncbi:Rv2578c family radical SAM protein [Streptomonospora nanhaiensis]|uniref:DNA repair photolyase n=1 Tax=Streptomonospora nanhaiensis TaxID=1323731 RepID=A0A853BQJ7_9ACTN|nr:Rv2578c family radical SAM protein [Streptomonospora nanhaiensis]MBV2365181.1 Rv2578c family radical SAM protein [Streptomonospora nanhaiensis]MBX9387393.1 Rv2578c family radical SAM protein [Streptomonospora nanhaiensis]NYI97453.1 DNA repair photolyase [Streptomonospora nanhaiensis]
MRWEGLRDDSTAPALFDRAAVAPAEPARGTGRAGLSAPGPGPIQAGQGDSPVAVEIRARSIINRVPGESQVPFRWTVNPYRGCSHACVYCFARRTHTYLDLDPGHDFDTKIMVKVNAGELLRRELAHPRWSGEPIAMGTNTDPYQRAEGRYRLMPEIIAALRDFANPFSILTKGRLILRDLHLLEQAARVTDVGLAVSVGSLDESVWRSVEPGTPRPASRLDVVRRCADRGLRCSVLMAPILPGLTDSPEQIDATVAAIAAAGAASLTPITLHLRPGAREWYLAWLAREHPRLVPRYRELYRRGAYAPKPYRALVAARVHEAARRHGLARPAGSADHRPAPPATQPPPTGQLALI